MRPDVSSHVEGRGGAAANGAWRLRARVPNEEASSQFKSGIWIYFFLSGWFLVVGTCERIINLVCKFATGWGHVNQKFSW